MQFDTPESEIGSLTNFRFHHNITNNMVKLSVDLIESIKTISKHVEITERHMIFQLTK